ncbi:hypothetical protein ALC62_07275 [Cyphomyrmex costatus]|uniref:Uncharacterized protein n=1 Tax=Cyphomyrmex costatus TaxID=456900 RepID=A0A195CNC1_9HYME|nr:hypothetical protein ALC62_07275 [Cyphomyrmex costatus]
MPINRNKQGTARCSAINRYKVDGRRALKPPLGSASTSRAAPHRFVSPSLTGRPRNEGGRCLTHLILTSPIDNTRERTRKDEKIEPCGRVGGETIIDRITRLSSRAWLFVRDCLLQISCEHELNSPLLNRKADNNGKQSTDHVGDDRSRKSGTEVYAMAANATRKKEVTSQPFKTKEDLRQRIHTACTKVTPEMYLE